MLVQDAVRVICVFLVPDVPVFVPPDMLLEVVECVYRVCYVYSVAKIRVTLFLAHSGMPINLSAGCLRKEDCGTFIDYGIRPGESRLENLDTDGMWAYMMRPIVDAQEATLQAKEREDLIPLLPRYNAFHASGWCLGPQGVVVQHVPGPITLPGAILRLAQTLSTGCGGLDFFWCAWWTMGGAATGDETLVPHTGLQAGPLKMYIARKPHNIGVKLYDLADVTSWYIMDMYLYTGCWGVLRRHGCGAGYLNARQLMCMWATPLQSYTVLVGDSFFGSCATAQPLVRAACPFITIVRKDTVGVQQGGAAAVAGETAVTRVDWHKYALEVYKQPKREGSPPNWCPSCQMCGTLRGDPSTTRSRRSTPSLPCTDRWHAG